MPGEPSPGSLRALAGALLDTLFPRACLACGEAPRDGEPFCLQCLAQIEPAPPHTCPRCGRPGNDSTCPACRRHPPAFRKARWLAYHQGPLARAVRDFKYKRRWVNGPELGRYLVRHTPPHWLEQVDLLVPVPLHRRRLMSRGFNQALVLARPLARRYQLELMPRLLIRRRYTRPQVGLNPDQRRQNVQDAFYVPPAQAELLRGKNVLLLDDVFTTGATADQCALTLKRAGARQVDILTLVRPLGLPPSRVPPQAYGAHGALP